MKRFSSLTLLLVSILILSACATGPTPPPTVNPVDLQNTAAAVAFTIVAATGSAVPTLTPAPTETATNTPAPTNTFLPLPSSAEPATPTAGVQDACEDQVLPGALEGKTVKIRINNSTKVTVNVSVYLNRTVPPVVCGYRAYVVEPGSSVVINDLVEGCFTIWAWNPDPKEYFMVTNGAASCIDSFYPAAFDISTRDIRQR